MTNYDISNKKEELLELIQALKTFAVMYEVPMFITCAIKNNEEGTVYSTDSITPAATNKVLADNKFPDLINVMNGAHTHYVSENTDVILDVIRELPSEITSEYADLTSTDIDEDDFYLGD